MSLFFRCENTSSREHSAQLFDQHSDFFDEIAIFVSMRKVLPAIIAILFAANSLSAQDYAEHFTDSTLRLNYVFCGDSQHQAIYFREAVKTGPWAGRRTNLSSPALRGDGQVRVFDAQTGKTLYVNSFATLFQEWQSTAEAARVQKAYENCLLVPFPKKPVEIVVALYDRHGNVSSRICHRIDPADILIRPAPESEAIILQENGALSETIDIVIVSEGYTEAEKEKFIADSRRAQEALFSHEPFTSSRGKFNVRAVFVPSLDSGVSLPGNHAWKRTAMSSHFDTFYSSRYLTSSSMWALHDAIGSVPFEHIIVLVNSSRYGGGGVYNSVTLSTADHPIFNIVLVHEFGHAFGGLADEYAYDEMVETVYPADTEPWEQNITTKKDFSSKWEDMMGGEVGLYEGAGNQSKGIWRPVPNCRMRTNDYPDFCPVCTRALLRVIDFYTGGNSRTSSSTSAPSPKRAAVEVKH